MTDDNDSSEQSGSGFELTRRKTLGTLGAVGAGAAFSGGGAYAFLSDTEESTGNVVTAGKLDLLIDWDVTYNGEPEDHQEPANNPGPIFELSDVKPGDYGEATISLDNKHNPAWVFVGGNLTTNIDNGITEPEDEVADYPDDPDGTGYGDLADTIMATVWIDDGNNKLESDEDVLAEGTLREVFDVLCRGVRFGEIAKNSKGYLGFKWELPAEVGNEVQSDKVAFDLLFHAQQRRHNDNPDNPFLPQPEKWVAEVPKPEAIDGTGTSSGSPLEIGMSEFSQNLHPDLPDTTVWGYNGSYPGPTIEAEKGETTYVKYKNDLPTDHLLPVDQTLHGSHGNPDVRTVTHLHGANVNVKWDGWPDAWYTSDGRVGNGPGTPNEGESSVTYQYANEQPASTLWYHDHAVGATRLNVYSGLAGFYLLRDPDNQKAKDLPGGENDNDSEYEMPLVLQDRSFCNDGSLHYPASPDPDESQFPNPSNQPEFFGDTSVVNGKVWPVLEVDPRKYRFRMLNGANSRFYNVRFYKYDESTNTKIDDDDAPGFTRIGTDGGFLNQPETVNPPNRLLFSDARRHDVVVDFNGFEGESLILHNDAESPYGGENSGSDLPEVMLFRVKDTDVDDLSEVPDGLGNVPNLVENGESDVDNERFLTLEEATDQFGRLKLQLNGTDWNPALDDENLQEKPTLGDTEVWHLVNNTPDTHPIHLHLVQFQVLGRNGFDTGIFDSNYDGDNARQAVETAGFTLDNYDVDEQAWYDTVSANPGEVTSIVVTFGEVDGEFQDLTGVYPWHCHILEHEDHEMMLPYTVEPSTSD